MRRADPGHRRHAGPVRLDAEIRPPLRHSARDDLAGGAELRARCAQRGFSRQGRALHSQDRVTAEEMNMKTMNFLIGTLLALVAAAAYAQAGSEPCKADFEKYCPGVKPGGGAVNACVQRHGYQFSPACKK